MIEKLTSLQPSYANDICLTELDTQSEGGTVVQWLAPPSHNKHAHYTDWQLQITQRCEVVCIYVAIVCMIDWCSVQGAPCPHPMDKW